MRKFRMLLFLLTVLLPAQTAPPAALVRGTLLERDAQTTAGELSVRAADNQVFRYRFDAKTYVERDEQTIDVSRLRPGEIVEVVSDGTPASPLRYARTIHVLPVPPPVRPSSQGRVRANRSPIDRVVPYGALALAGVVFRLNADRVVLHTRQGGDQTILLRQDTRYLEDGEVVGANDLKPNMRVFVRAGRTLYNELEAYQVIWGRILMPH
jgi:hypothetical protein